MSPTKRKETTLQQLNFKEAVSKTFETASLFILLQDNSVRASFYFALKQRLEFL